jgi:diguanylate cyclase (GGDEF)-like protein
MRDQRIFGKLLVLAAFFVAAGAQGTFVFASSPRVLGSARAVHELPLEDAARVFPVHLRAVVTYYDPYIDPRRGALFVQDATGGVFVSVPRLPILPIKAGDLVDITGVTGPGDYAPIVSAGQVRRIGQSRLPDRPPKASFAQLLAGNSDCQWVESEGRVRSAHVGSGNAILGIATVGGTLSAVTVQQPGVDYESLVDSQVRIYGVAAPITNHRRQMVGVRIFFPALDQIEIIQSGPLDPFTVPTIPIANLFRYSPGPEPLHRVHVHGLVTLNWPGRILCIQDGNSGICMQTTDADSARVGSFVDVVGFPSINLFTPTFDDAVFRVDNGPATPASPVLISADQTHTDELDGRLVQIDAELIGRNLAAADPTLMLRAGRSIFPVILPKDVAPASVSWKDGSVLRITGVYNARVDSLNTNLIGGLVHLQSMNILLRSVDDLSLLQAPSWWTAEHTLESFSAVSLLILAAFIWIAVLRRRVAQQTQALRSSEQRLRHLSEHDALTGLPNRLLLNDRLQSSLKRARRVPSLLGLLMIDVDGFKGVNDTLGHEAGDCLLCELANRLTASVRATDTVARMGGDEFVVLLPDLRNPAEAEAIADKILVAVSTPAFIAGVQVTINLSIGGSIDPGGVTDAETLLRSADRAMYSVKCSGKNGFQVYSPNRARAAERAAAEPAGLHSPLAEVGA